MAISKATTTPATIHDDLSQSTCFSEAAPDIIREDGQYLDSIPNGAYRNRHPSGDTAHPNSTAWPVINRAAPAVVASPSPPLEDKNKPSQRMMYADIPMLVLRTSRTNPLRLRTVCKNRLNRSHAGSKISPADIPNILGPMFIVILYRSRALWARISILNAASTIGGDLRIILASSVTFGHSFGVVQPKQATERNPVHYRGSESRTFGCLSGRVGQ